MRFVDTNILVYAEQPEAGAKHIAACALLRDLWDKRDGLISAQVLQELFVTVTRKSQRPYSAEQARGLIERYATWTVVPVTKTLVLLAIELQAKARISHWDAAIVAAALSGGASELLTEDLNPGQKIQGLLIRNPLPA